MPCPYKNVSYHIDSTKQGHELAQESCTQAGNMNKWSLWKGRRGRTRDREETEREMREMICKSGHYKCRVQLSQQTPLSPFTPALSICLWPVWKGCRWVSLILKSILQVRCKQGVMIQGDSRAEEIPKRYTIYFLGHTFTEQRNATYCTVCRPCVPNNEV